METKYNNSEQTLRRITHKISEERRKTHTHTYTSKQAYIRMKQKGNTKIEYAVMQFMYSNVPNNNMNQKSENNFYKATHIYT